MVNSKWINGKWFYGKWLYGIGLALLFAALYWLNSLQPVKYVWEPTYDTDDKQPCGAYVFDKLLHASWEKGYSHCYKSITDLQEEGILDGKNILIVTKYFNPAEREIEILQEYIRDGGKAFVAAEFYGKEWKEKFTGFYSTYRLEALKFLTQFDANPIYDTLRFCTPALNQEYYKMPDALCMGYFKCDTSKMIKDTIFAVAKAKDEEVIMLRCQMGKGSLLLSCNPLMYTNYGVLCDTANVFIWNTLSGLQDKPLIRTEYYHLGSNAKKNQSPLRYLHSNPPLKWALNITVLTILIFMLFTAKRKQKTIPIVKPPQNKMLDFVRSVAGLYIRKNNNADIILKKQIYWADSLKRNYGIDIINESRDNEFFARLSGKTGKPAEELSLLFRYLDKINENTYVPDNQMMEIITQINSIK